MPPLNAVPNLALTLDGLVMVFTSPNDESCSLGILRHAPAGHSLNIAISQLNAQGVSELLQTIHPAGIANHLEIAVSNTSKTGISRRGMEMEIDRLRPAEENLESFRWVVDFENEIYKTPIGAKKDGFASFLTVNHGELCTRRRSKNKLLLKRGVNGVEEEFGFVATKFGIDIVLDQPQSRAVFKNGNRIIFEATPESKYILEVNRGCEVNAGNDADSYYTAVGDQVPDEEKFFFSATPLPAGLPNDPDARCPGMYMSRSVPI